MHLLIVCKPSDSCQSEAMEDNASCAGKCRWRGLDVVSQLTMDQNLGFLFFLAYLDASSTSALTKTNPYAKNVSLIFYMKLQLTLLLDFSMIEWFFFCTSCQNIFLPGALSVWMFFFFTCLFEVNVSQRFEMCERTSNH